MTNHFHLLFETTAPNLALGMHRLNHQYALYFNERHGFEGHLFEKRYWSRLIEADEHLAATIAYIAFNPVKSGLCAVPWRVARGAASSRWTNRSPSTDGGRRRGRVRCQAPGMAGLAEAVRAWEPGGQETDK